MTPLGWIDFFFGGAIGLLKTAFLFWILCFALSVFPLGINKMTLHRSMVFQTYKRLPGYLKPAGLARLRETLKIDSFPAIRPQMLNKGRRREPPREPQEKNNDSAANVI